MHIYIHTHVHVHIKHTCGRPTPFEKHMPWLNKAYIYIHTHTYICVCICIYMYTHIYMKRTHAYKNTPAGDQHLCGNTCQT